MTLPESALSHLACPACERIENADGIHTTCPACGSPLLASYNLEGLEGELTKGVAASKKHGLWRWAGLLPVRRPFYRLQSGLGESPLLRLENLGKQLGLAHLYLKNEQDLEERRLVVALSRALELGLRKVTPASDTLERLASRARIQVALGGFDLSIWQEPYGLEGLKTCALEIAEAFGWQLPDVLVAPDEAMLVAAWKAFEETRTLGLTGEKRPRMVTVQAGEAHPLAQAVLEQSNGISLPVSTEEIASQHKNLAASEGILPSPPGAAGLAVLKQLLTRKWLMPGERVVLINTGNGLNFLRGKNGSQ